MKDKNIEFAFELCKHLSELISNNSNFFNNAARSLSNTLFDCTQSKYFSIGEIYHKDGIKIQKENIKREREEKTKIINELKAKRIKTTNEITQTPNRKAYKEKRLNLKNKKKILTEGIIVLEVEKSKLKPRGKVDFLKEHVLGRDTAAKKILTIFNKNTSFEEFEKLVEIYACTIRIEKHKNFHTKVNKELEKIQNDNISLEGYKNIIKKYGYVWDENISVEHFNNFNIF